MIKYYPIENGDLEILVKNEQFKIDDILDFASRENPKRGYLFVSKILGKHLPVKPSTMRKSYDFLAKEIGNDLSTFAVGMSETATGLGAGVADSLAKIQLKQVFYQHTTRHICQQEIWCQIDESHSHAVDHILYKPSTDLLPEVERVEKLILIDDEVSTGRTLKVLGDKLLPKLKQVKEVVIVSLVNWLTKNDLEQFSSWNIKVKFVSLLEGEFNFVPKPNLILSLPTNIDKELCESNAINSYGRLAVKMPYIDTLPEINASNPITFVGDGEHLFYPFLCAEKSENLGNDVVFQSSTRSPIMLGNAISAKQSFKVYENKDVEHYIYNLDSINREVLFFIENESNREHHDLGKLYPLRALS